MTEVNWTKEGYFDYNGKKFPFKLIHDDLTPFIYIQIDNNTKKYIIDLIKNLHEGAKDIKISAIMEEKYKDESIAINNFSNFVFGIRNKTLNLLGYAYTYDINDKLILNDKVIPYLGSPGKNWEKYGFIRIINGEIVLDDIPKELKIIANN